MLLKATSMPSPTKSGQRRLPLIEPGRAMMAPSMDKRGMLSSRGSHAASVRTDAREDRLILRPTATRDNEGRRASPARKAKTVTSYNVVELDDTDLSELEDRSVMSQRTSAQRQPRRDRAPQDSDFEDQQSHDESSEASEDEDSEDDDLDFRSPRQKRETRVPAADEEAMLKMPPDVDKLLAGLGDDLESLSVSDIPQRNILTASPLKQLTTNEPSQESTFEDAIIRFSPPGRLRPTRPAAPPDSPKSDSDIQPSLLKSPSKTASKLTSPRKQIKRIPPAPNARPSLDGFWDFDQVNDWNEQHSPRKTIKSIRLFDPASDDSFGAASNDSTATDVFETSPVKQSRLPIQKQTATQAALRKAFNAKKEQLAADFLRTLDETVTNGKVAQMTASTGGIAIVWSKKLNSTAGRAHWRKEMTRSSSNELLSQSNASKAAQQSTTIERHVASIELAEKVIDDEHRLYNVVAHEFCHLANFMVSGIKDQPHGKSFQQWARKVTSLYAKSHNVEVTTKHDYEIAYKYIWLCSSSHMGTTTTTQQARQEEGCGAEYKRHSKSIDPTRQRCGRCKGRLLQVKPKPAAASGQTDKADTYQAFVKLNYKAVQRDLGPGSPAKDVMKELGARYRLHKEANARQHTVTEASRSNSREDTPSSFPDEEDKVVRRLDFLHLS